MAARVAAIVFVTLVVQVSFVARVPAFDARADLLLLVAVAAGVSGGPERGALVGFAAGLAFDLLLDTPIGLSALVYTVVGYGVGSVQGSVLRPSRSVSVISVVVGSIAGVVLYALLGQLLGQGTLDGPSLTAIVGVVAMVNALLALAAVRGMRWAFTDTSERHFSSR